MFLPPASVSIPVRGREYLWTPKAGLDPAVVATVEGWLRRTALALVQTASRRGVDLDDLLQAGRLGALEAARRFDPAQRNYLTYAKYAIRRHMLAALGNGDAVHQTRRAKLQALKSGGMPTVLRLGNAVGEDLSLEDSLPSFDAILERTEGAERLDYLRRALSRLEPQERLLLGWRYGLEGQPALSLREAGLRLVPPVDHERVRQLQKRAESRLRSALRELGLRPESKALPSQPVTPTCVPPPDPPINPPTPGTRRAEREARRRRRAAVLGTPLPFDVPA